MIEYQIEIQQTETNFICITEEGYILKMIDKQQVEVLLTVTGNNYTIVSSDTVDEHQGVCLLEIFPN